jgi:hypothetical protein
MALVRRPYPRFVADSPQEKAPYGRWEERLVAEIVSACEPYASEAGAALDPEAIKWFPERAWGGRVYVPFASHAETDEGNPIEYFGHVSFVRPEGGDEEPHDIRAKADFTDVTAADNPDWQIDLNDEVIGTWKADGGRGGDVTLIWGLPLIRGAIAASAEIEGESLDQAAVDEGRFTLVAVDAIHGFGDDLYLEVKLWDRRVREIASESLYAEPESEEPAAAAEESGPVSPVDLAEAADDSDK